MTSFHGSAARSQVLGDKRKNTRRALRYTAWIGSGENAPLRGCIVSDISENGAKLHVESAEDLPDEFQLLLSGRGGIYRQCRAVWRTKDQIGVQFERAFERLPRPKAVHLAIV
jgi:hypothetical protein